MVEMKTYECDRCVKIFSKPIGKPPSFIVRHDNDYIPDETNEGETFQLCDDCIRYFWRWTGAHSDDLDKFVESMEAKWAKEEEGEESP